MNDQHTSAGRNGFTLLEVIIASSLAATLMLLVWSLFSVYSKLSDKGARQATELQLVRSLLRQLRADIHLARGIATSEHEGFSPLAIDDTFSAFGDQSADLPSLPSGAELLGGATRLQFVVRSRRRGEAKRLLEQADRDEGVTPRVYDVIEYVWEPARQSLLSDNEVLEQGEFQGELQLGLTTDELADSSPGLTRRVTPWFTRHAVRETETPDNGPHSFSPLPDRRTAVGASERSARHQGPQASQGQRASQEDAVPEVDSLRFRYFDGRVWLSQWDSRGEGRLPAAIELSFNLRQRIERKKDNLRQEDNRRQTDRQAVEEQFTVGDHPREEEVDIPSLGERSHPMGLNRGAGETRHKYRFVIAVDTARHPDGQHPDGQHFLEQHVAAP